MYSYFPAGFGGAVAGALLAALALLLALPAGLALLLAPRPRGAPSGARGILAAAGVLAACGGLMLGACALVEWRPFLLAMENVALPVLLLAPVGAGWAGWRIGRGARRQGSPGA